MQRLVLWHAWSPVPLLAGHGRRCLGLLAMVAGARVRRCGRRCPLVAAAAAGAACTDMPGRTRRPGLRAYAVPSYPAMGYAGAACLTCRTLPGPIHSRCLDAAQPLKTCAPAP